MASDDEPDHPLSGESDVGGPEPSDDEDGLGPLEDIYFAAGHLRKFLILTLKGQIADLNCLSLRALADIADAASRMASSFGLPVFVAAPAPGSFELQFTIPEETVTGPEQRFTNTILSLGDLAADPDSDEPFEHAMRALHVRFAKAYSDVIHVLAEHRLESHWSTGDRKISVVLTADQAIRTDARLNEKKPGVPYELDVTGHLYLANGKGSSFRIDADGFERVIMGTYDPSLASKVRTHWDTRVHARLRCTPINAPKSRRPEIEYTLIQLERDSAAIR